jgi:outer membrane protein assembly factor BamE (lipoprotein component of BamABCDE complex)
MVKTSSRRLFVLCLLSVAGCVSLDAAFAAPQNPQSPQSSTTQASLAPTYDRTQWRKLHRHMSKDEVKNLLGDPDTISVSRFAEVWSYLRGSVTFDGKGRLDMWTEF